MNRVAKLILTSIVNNNKYYNMTETGSTIQVVYGRVGATECHATYPSCKWDSIYKSKLKKGYRDVTELRQESNLIDFQTITSDVISAFVLELQSYAKGFIQQNYTVSSEVVTQKQVDEAQKILDKLSLMAAKKINEKVFDDSLIELFQVIPRKMSVVKNHLLAGGNKAEDLLLREQDTLDVMKGQVRTSSAQKTNTIENKQTILDAMGLSIEQTTEEDIKKIKQMLGEISSKFSRAFKITNARTEKQFNQFVSARPNKTSKLLWHGSRSENWWNILDSGLLIRPSGAILTGSMYGNGIYGADKARKSLGYTSCQNSYWARGSATKGFMALFDFHLGNTLLMKHREPWAGQTTEALLKSKGDYDSISALGGADLINNEFIVYNTAQTTIRYIVEVLA